MNNKNYTSSLTVDQSPEEVFNAIINVRGWWSQETEGETDKPNSVFYYHYRDIHRCVLKITELVSHQKVVWRVLHNEFNFIEDKNEWTRHRYCLRN